MTNDKRQAMPRKKKKSPTRHKHIAQRAHAKRRLQERYGIELTAELRRELLSQIRSGEAKFLERQSRRLTIHVVKVGEDVEIPVVYDSVRGEIVTVLLQEWLEEEIE